MKTTFAPSLQTRPVRALGLHPRIIPANSCRPRALTRRLGRASLHALRFPEISALVLAALILACLAATTQAQPFAIDWFSVDGGGGTSTGGVYAVSGTVGQPDAGGPMSGGQYSVTGGFWSLLAVVPSPGAPPLAITRTTTNTVVVSWPSPSLGFTLQENSDLRTTNWTSAGAATDNGTNKFIIVNPPAGNRFYRLYKP